MNARLLLILLLECLLAVFLHADTLTLRNNTEINGWVSYSDDAFSVVARYSSGKQNRTYGRGEVRTLEFNQRDFNSGAPPKDISVFEGRKTATQSAAHDMSAQAHQVGKNASAESSAANSHSSSVGHSVLAGDENPTADVIWLRSKQKLTGRLMEVKNGKLTFQVDKKDKNLQSGDVAGVLVAPN